MQPRDAITRVLLSLDTADGFPDKSIGPFDT